MRVKAVILGLMLSWGVPVSAHSIFVDCDQEAGTVDCLASFSDGSRADNLPYEVISYDDELLLAGRSDEQSQFRFDVPDAEYYILFDAGPGHVVEVDMQDVVQP